MRTLFVLLGLMIGTGCKTANSVSPQPSSAPSSSAVNQELSLNPALLVKDESGSGAPLITNLVSSDSLRNDGLSVFSEKITNISNSPMVIQVSASGSVYRLFTRIHEQVAMQAYNMCGLSRDYWKVSHVDLYLSEIVVARAAGVIERDDISSGKTEFNLSAQESVQVFWVVRAPDSSTICPFYSSVNQTFPMGGTQLKWFVVGSNLSGDFNRTLTAQIMGSDGTTTNVPFVSQLDQSYSQMVDDGSVKSDDRDFGCNGLMQNM